MSTISYILFISVMTYVFLLVICNMWMDARDNKRKRRIAAKRKAAIIRYRNDQHINMNAGK